MKANTTLRSIGLAGLVSIGAVVYASSEVPSAGIVTREELGRLLFWDPILSGERDVACASCHHPDFAYSDGRDLSLGAGSFGLGPDRVDRSGGVIPPVKRNAPTLLNAALNGLTGRRGDRRGTSNVVDIGAVNQAAAPMFWDHRARSLEAQALEPIRTLEEMRGTAYPEELAVDSVIARLRSIPEYVALFAGAFGTAEPIGADQLASALAAFERTLIAADSPFDRFQAGDESAMTAQQRRGLRTFNDVGCDRCHVGPMFTDFDLRTIGIRENPLLADPDQGADNRFRFRTPTLRNVALTAPYMHNGMLPTLRDVLEFYDNGRSENPAVTSRDGRGGGGGGGGGGTVARVDQDFRRIDNLSNREITDIIAFLEALTDPNFDRTIPARVPSGLPPGGNIGSP